MIERGPTLMRSVVAFDFAYSHSLLGLAIAGGVFALAALLRRQSARAAALLALAVLSHWLLDVVSHHPDTPLVPGGRHLLGLGLWDSIPATIVVEGGAWLTAVLAFGRFTHPRTRAARWLFWPAVMFLTLAWWNNVAGPPPPDLSGMAATSGIFFSLVVAWAWWIDRVRTVG